MIFIARGHTNGRTKATTANIIFAIWLADGLSINIWNTIWLRFERKEFYITLVI